MISFKDRNNQQDFDFFKQKRNVEMKTETFQKTIIVLVCVCK